MKTFFAQVVVDYLLPQIKDYLLPILKKEVDEYLEEKKASLGYELDKKIYGASQVIQNRVETRFKSILGDK